MKFLFGKDDQSKHSPEARYTKLEEWWHYQTHAFGAVLGVIGLVFLLAKALQQSDWVAGASWVVFGLSMIYTFGSSAVYHKIKDPKRKRLFRVFDHIGIYVLIAGSYTPFALNNLRDGWGMTVFVGIWSLAIIGIVMKVFFSKLLFKYDYLDLIFYVAMGCSVVLFIQPIAQNIADTGFYLLLLGGASYLVGAAFYGLKKIEFHHVYFHFFVIGGALSHYFAVLYFTNPPA